MFEDKLKMEGFVTAELYEDGQIVHTTKQKNLIVDTGKNTIARRIAYPYEAVINKISIGSGTEQPELSDTGLSVEKASYSIPYIEIKDNNVIVFISGFPEGVGDGPTRETGLFDSDDNLICRTLFSTPFFKGSSQFLNIIWKLQIS